MFERDEKILVQLLLLAAGLMFQAFTLLNRVVLLGVTGRNFLAVDAALGRLRTVVGSSGESLASGTSSFGRCVTNVG